MSKKKSPLLAVVRIRGSVGLSYNIKYTLQLLHLTRSNHAVIIPNDPTHKGMLQKIKDVATWGEIKKTTAKALIEKRGRLKGNKPIDNDFLKNHKFTNLSEFVNALFDGKADMRKIEELKPLFRLHPPRKGFKSVKNPYTRGGDLGYRGEKINDLLEKMM